MFSAPLLQYKSTIVLTSTTAFMSEVKQAAGIRFHRDCGRDNISVSLP